MNGALYFDEITARRIDTLQDTIESLSGQILSLEKTMRLANDLTQMQLVAINKMNTHDEPTNMKGPDRVQPVNGPIEFDGFCSHIEKDCKHLWSQGHFIKHETEERVQIFRCNSYFTKIYKDDNGRVVACHQCIDNKGVHFNAGERVL